MCSWVNVNEEITANEFFSSQDTDEDVEVVEICEKHSKEFQLGGKNILRVSVTNTTTEHLKSLLAVDLPHTILWNSVLSAFESCTDFQQLQEMVHEIKDRIPELEKHVPAHFFEDTDVIDNVAQAEIPIDGPVKRKAIATQGDGNCLTRSLSKGHFNTDSRHLEFHA